MKKDYLVIRELAQRYREAAEDPRNEERRALHRAVVELRMIRPVVLIDEIPWGEFQAEDLRPLCEDPFLRGIEERLRRGLYQWKHFPADMIMPPYVPVAKAVYSTGNGLTVEGEVIPGVSGDHISSHSYTDQLAEEEDLEKLHIPQITHDTAATAERVVRAEDALGGLLPVRAMGPLLYCETADLLMQYRGMDNLLFDLIDRPEFIHAAMERLTDIFLGTLRQYQELGLLDAGLPAVHCTAAQNDTLPDYGETEGPVKPSEIWGRGMAQVFATVSPAMHEEFDIPYMKRAMEPFGLVYYGCCEPLHKKLHILEQIPHLRKISISPWADVREAAEGIGKRYVAAIKAQPSNLAGTLDLSVVDSEIRNILGAVREHGCSCDIVLKDLSTVGYHPENLEQWEQHVMNLVRAG